MHRRGIDRSGSPWRHPEIAQNHQIAISHPLIHMRMRHFNVMGEYAPSDFQHAHALIDRLESDNRVRFQKKVFALNVSRSKSTIDINKLQNAWITSVKRYQISK